jgi:hypothetical protein
MYARQVEEQSTELDELKRDELQLVGLTALCFGLALAAHGRPTIALPLLTAGLGGAFLAMRAFWRRWDLVDRLLLEREAYFIDEVGRRARCCAELENRRSLAASIRWRLENATALRDSTGRLHSVTAELAELACELEDESLELDPFRAVECERMLTDGASSPLVDGVTPVEDVLAGIRRIRSGFTLHDSPSGV